MSEKALTIHSLFHPYEVVFDPVSASSFSELVGDHPFHCLIDSHVLALHEERLGFLKAARSVIQVPPLEHRKSLETAGAFCHHLLEAGITKKDRLVVIGGGLTQDLGAFCGHVLKRGVPWVFLPTTLLAMCDSCIGSKYGINMASYKNQIGGFCPPSGILVDIAFLKTLDPTQKYAGLGEIVKVHIIAGREDFDVMASARPEELVDGGPQLEALIRRSLEIKKEIVEADEFDSDYRHILNYGHTFGHAIESYTENRVPHGIAVSMGMEIANYLSFRYGFLPPASYALLSETIRRYIPEMKETFDDAGRMEDRLRQDKKFDGRMLTALLCKGPGNVFQHPVEISDSLCRDISQCFREESRTS